MINLIHAERVTAPGFYRMPAEAYRTDPCPEPSLNAGTARLLLGRSPSHARHAHPRLAPPETPAEMPSRIAEIGTAAHRLILGEGPTLEVIDAADYKKADARASREAAYIEGRAPILRDDYAHALAIREAFLLQIERTPVAEAFHAGLPEVVLAWQERGLWCRGMVDMLRVDGARAWLFDVKTTAASAEHAAAARRLFDMGYDLQAMFYRRGLAALMPAVTEAESYIITIENTLPYGLSVVSLSWETAKSGEKEVWKALALWERCLQSGEWPGYPPAIATATLPAWLELARSERELNDRLIRALDLARFSGTAPEKVAGDDDPFDLLMAG